MYLWSIVEKNMAIYDVAKMNNFIFLRPSSSNVMDQCSAHLCRNKLVPFFQWWRTKVTSTNKSVLLIFILYLHPKSLIESIFLFSALLFSFLLWWNKRKHLFVAHCYTCLSSMCNFLFVLFFSLSHKRMLKPQWIFHLKWLYNTIRIMRVYLCVCDEARVTVYVYVFVCMYVRP